MPLTNAEAGDICARFPDQIPDTGWDYGADLSYMKELLSYWLDEFDWPVTSAEAETLREFAASLRSIPVARRAALPVIDAEVERRLRALGYAR